jgi:hypothetical protein
MQEKLYSKGTTLVTPSAPPANRQPYIAATLGELKSTADRVYEETCELAEAIKSVLRGSNPVEGSKGKLQPSPPETVMSFEVPLAVELATVKETLASAAEILRDVRLRIEL